MCVLWGTTYLGIRIAIEALPPFYFLAIRYTISGAILLIAVRIAGVQLPRGRELLATSACGIICIGVGNGCLAVAEQWVPSGMAALFFTTCPFWMIGIDALLPGGRRPFGWTIRGLLVGLAGVVILVMPGALREGIRGGTLLGFLVLQLSAVGWATGALLQKRVETQALPLVSGAVQQFAAGLAMFIPAAMFEKAPTSISVQPALAVAYLVVFGSIIGFSSFIYCMSRLPVAVVSLYTFVNPVIALFLGWLFFREPFGHRDLLAMLIIFAGIGIVRWSESSKALLSPERASSIGRIEEMGPEP